MNKSYMVNSQFVIEEQDNALKLSNSLIIAFSRRRGKRFFGR
jgi:hypothetical protein